VGAAPSCDPFTPPTFRGDVPTGHDVLGFDLGSQEVTAAQSDAYVAAVDAASPRVVSGVFGHSVEGRPLTYATTQEFLSHFGLKSRRDLPGMDDLQAAGLLDPVDTALERLGLETPDEDDDEVELETDAEDA